MKPVIECHLDYRGFLTRRMQRYWISCILPRSMRSSAGSVFMKSVGPVGFLIIRANSKQHISKFRRTTMPKLAVGRAVAEHPLLSLQVCLFAISSVYGT